LDEIAELTEQVFSPTEVTARNHGTIAKRDHRYLTKKNILYIKVLYVFV